MDTNELIAEAEASMEGVKEGFVERAADVLPDLIAALRAEKEARDHANACNRGLVRLNEALQIRAERAEAQLEVALETTLHARVAMAYRDAAEKAEQKAKFTAEAMQKATADQLMANLVQVTASRTAYDIADAIRRRTPADASAALDRIRQEAADEALERAAVRIEGSSYVTGLGGARALEPVSVALKGMDQHHATIAAAIRALKGGAK